MARTTFKIQPDILQDLRIKAGKKQLDVGLYLRGKFGKPSNQEKIDSATSVYQKIERTGHTSKKTAEALAEYFHVPLEVLQGDERIDPLKQITARLTRLLDEGTNEFLNTAFKKIEDQDTIFISLDDSGFDNINTQEDNINELANDINKRIESAQWARDSAELTKIKQLTGLTDSELSTPAYVEGNWWIISRGAVLNKDFPSTATVIRGVTELTNLVKKSWDNSWFSNRVFSDQSIILSRHGLWYRIESHEPAINNYEWGIDFVRCEPDGAKGIRWVAASPSDKWFLENELRLFAYSNANIVINFDGKQIPKDVRHLCFVVTQREIDSDTDIARMVVRGCAHERTKSQISFDIEHRQEYAMIKAGLAANLKRSLHPILKNHSTELWHVSEEGFFSNPHLTLMLLEDTPLFVNSNIHKKKRSYQISLMEEMADGSFVHSPWPLTSINNLSEAVKEWINTPLPDGGYDDSAIFEPLTEAK